MVEVDLLRIVSPLQPNVTFLIGNQNAPTPEHVFCFISEIGSRNYGMPEISNVSDMETISTLRRYSISFTYHGVIQANPAQYTRHLDKFFNSRGFPNLLAEKGYSLISVGGVVNAPVLKGVDIYTSSTIDIVVATRESDQFKVDVIDLVHIDGKLGQIDYEHKVEVK